MTESNPIIQHSFQSHTFLFNQTEAAPVLIQEIFSDCYKVLESKIEFRPGDVILDLGANEGMFSIFMAKLFPQAIVHALEPVPSTYSTLVGNIGLNGCTNISPHMIGAGRNNETVQMTCAKTFSGGSTSYCTFDPAAHIKVPVQLLPLDEIWSMLGLDRVRFLKIDIEGAEYDAIYPSTILPKVDYMAGEFHTNRRLDYMSRRMDALATWCGNMTKLVHVECCRMCE